MTMLPLLLLQHHNIKYKIDFVKNTSKFNLYIWITFHISLVIVAAAATDLWQLLKRIVHMCVCLSLSLSRSV